MKLNRPAGVIFNKALIPECPSFLRKELRRLFTFNNPLYAQILRHSPYGYVSPKIPEFIELFDDIEPRGIAVPRGIRLDHLTSRSQALFRSVKWEDQRLTAPARFPKLMIEPNDEQVFLFEAFKKDLVLNPAFGSFLYVSPTGTGKTLLQAMQAKYLGQRTLILVTTDQIRRTWYSLLEKAFGLVHSDIGLIQRKKFVIGKSFTIASVMTLNRRRQKWDRLFERFGTIIADEADLITMPSFWQFLMACPCKYLIGATATDSAERGNSYYLRSCFGATRKRIKAPTEDTSTSMTVRKVDTVNTTFKYLPVEPDMPLDWHDLTETLITDECRNQLIVSKVIRDLRKNIPVLLVTKRLDHVYLLREMLRTRGVKTNLLTGETNIDSMYTEKLIEGIFSGKIKCVIATMQAVKRGANLNPLAALHLGMPVMNKDDLEQLIGRIRRKHEGKTECKVVYYWDVEVSYLFNVYKRIALPVFRRLRIPGYENLYVA